MITFIFSYTVFNELINIAHNHRYLDVANKVAIQQWRTAKQDKRLTKKRVKREKTHHNLKTLNNERDFYKSVCNTVYSYFISPRFLRRKLHLILQCKIQYYNDRGIDPRRCNYCYSASADLLHKLHRIGIPFDVFSQPLHLARMT